jgi:hypothetical protein
VIGGVLHLGALVVVGEDHDVALGGEAAEFLLEFVQLGHGAPRGSVLRVMVEYTGWRTAAVLVGVSRNVTRRRGSSLFSVRSGATSILS